MFPISGTIVVGICGKLLDRMIRSFWDVKGDRAAIWQVSESAGSDDVILGHINED